MALPVLAFLWFAGSAFGTFRFNIHGRRRTLARWGYAPIAEAKRRSRSNSAIAREFISYDHDVTTGAEYEAAVQIRPSSPDTPAALRIAGSTAEWARILAFFMKRIWKNAADRGARHW
jgi:hypothetical protein